MEWIKYSESQNGQELRQSYYAVATLGTLYRETISFLDTASGLVKDCAEAEHFADQAFSALVYTLQDEKIKGEKSERLYSAPITGGFIYLTITKYIDSANGYIRSCSMSMSEESTLDVGGVNSVNSQTGNVVLTTSDIAEGSNLYFTDARFDTDFAGKTTDDLAEGSTNLYYTDARVLADPITGFVSGAGVVADTDTILQAINKLDGNELAFESAFDDNTAISVTLDHSIGATNVKAFKNRNVCTLFIPALSWADGLGTAIGAAAASIPGAFAPAANTKIPVCIVDNSVAAIGNLVVGSDGSLALYADAGSTGFTNAQAGSCANINVTYTLI